MPCTTLLVGRAASYDGSTMIARNDDSGSGHFTAKRFTVEPASDKNRTYRSVLSHVEIPLPDHAMRYTCTPNALEGEGIWAGAGVNEEQIAMTATETITSNALVLGADPLVTLVPAKDGQEEIPGGIGEEDLVVLVLPYIHSAREGVLRLGSLLETYGTYEMNGIAFQDVNEIWWLETIGGHHWIAKRVPDDSYVVMPNQFGIDDFDLEDAFGEQREHLCSADLREFIRDNHLDLSLDGTFHARYAFGSHADSDHIYNTPRAWWIERYLNPRSNSWDGMDADFRPEDDDIPWCRVPEKKITVEDVKYALSHHFQGTPYDPYGKHAPSETKGMYRPVGISRTDFMGLIQIRPYVPKEISAIEWMAFGSNVFNAAAPFYANTESIPDYLSVTTGDVSTDSFYWTSRLIGALADAHFQVTDIHIERYQDAVQAESHRLLNRFDKAYTEGTDVTKLTEEANTAIADMLRSETQKALNHVLYAASCEMKNSFARSDA